MITLPLTHKTKHTLSFVLIYAIAVFTCSCKKSNSSDGGTSSQPPKPIITIPSVDTPYTNFDRQTHATYETGHDVIISGGYVDSYHVGILTARGVCWSTTPNPTIANNFTVDGTDPGDFKSTIMGLSVNTKYYIRAYATNSAGTGYSDQMTFTTYYALYESFGGGQIVYIDQTGLHGIIAAIYAGGYVPWGAGGAAATSTKDGASNTAKMLKAFGTGATNAATYCANCRDGGFSDWFLPAITQLTYVGIPQNGDTYWSSTEISDGAAYIKTNPYGNFVREEKSNLHEVLPMRAF